MQQWLNSHRDSTPPRARPSRVGPTATHPRTYTSAAPALAAPVPATITIRGPDGTLRTFPVEGSAVVQPQVASGQSAPAFVSVRDADGVVRSYPVVSPSQPASVPVR